MDEPDKIYLAFKNGFIAQSSNVKEDANGNSIFLKEHKPVEYIRKGAILKWIKEQEDKLEYGISADAYKLALDMLREKLESM